MMGCMNPAKRIKPSLKMPLVYLTMHVSVYFCLISAIFPYAETTKIVVLVSCEIACLIAWVSAMLSEPGYIKKPKNIQFVDTLQMIDPVQCCPDCEVVRTPRSRHCAICNRCVERFDHHCPWINNCVGVGNHLIFITFLVLTFVQCLLALLIGIDDIIEKR